MNQPKKSLGQHWLHDQASLQAVAQAAELNKHDIVLEIGPGLGTLSKVLVQKAGRVMAVELDEELAAKLPGQVDAPNFEVVSGDILKYNLTALPAGYKVVANIPYYLTGKLLRVMTDSVNPPAGMALLVQKEVAERLAASVGQMSLLAVAVQLDYEPLLGPVVPARLFTPPPKVDSQIITLRRRSQPLFTNIDRLKFMQIVKAGFSEKRKKLRSSLAGGLGISKAEADRILGLAHIEGDLRAQQLSLDDWHNLYKAATAKRYSAGGVVVEPGGRIVVVNQDGLTWSLPKGGIEPNEAEIDAARREIYEETGIKALKLIKKLGSYERFAMGLKGEDLPDRPRHITMFLFTAQSQALKPRDPANPEARWVEVDKVENLLTHPKDKAFFRSIKAAIAEVTAG